MALTRRQFIRNTLAFGGGLLFPVGWRSAAAEENPPRFLLHIVYEKGWDCSYLFDARKLAMTEAGEIQNYLGREPLRWTTRHGDTALASPIVKPLQSFKEDISVVLGVHMSSFEGHLQNMNVLFSGSPFGGESFVPHLHETGKKFPLDYVQLGDVEVNATNSAGGVRLSPESFDALILKSREGFAESHENPLFGYLRSRYEHASRGGGAFSQGAAQLASSADRLFDLVEPLKGIPFDEGAEGFAGSISVMSRVFQRRLAKACVFIRSHDIDSHSVDAAARMPQLHRVIVAEIQEVLHHLKSTPFDRKRSLFDVTTVVITSEFSRSMRQPNHSISATGTDHNPFGNMFLLAGRGIRGGRIIGRTDRHEVGEKVSKAHETRDRKALKIMGRPFDFASEKVRTDLPETYLETDYITCASVINTVYESFGVPKKYHRIIGRRGPRAPVLKGLLRA